MLLPPGVVTFTLSPALFPSRALPTGLSSEIRPFFGSASTGPTMVKFSSPYSSLTLTFEPSWTVPAAFLEGSLMISALRIVFSRVRIRPSIQPW